MLVDCKFGAYYDRISVSSKYAMSLDANALLLVLFSPEPPPGHVSIKNHLGWQDSTYTAAKKQLVDLGLAVVGHGGSLRRVQAPEGWDPSSSRAKDMEPWEFAPAPTRETLLYAPLVRVLAANWMTDQNPQLPLAVHNTAHAGSAKTGGRWSRPDAVAVWVRRFTYVPGDFLEVSTFEIKPFNNIDVLAVYEAVAHRRAATHAYVVIHAPAHLSSALRDRIKAVRSVAAAHGVGLIRFSDPDDFSSWKIVLDAERFEPDPEKLNRFIEKQLPKTTRTAILEKLGRIAENVQETSVSEAAKKNAN